MSPFFNKAIDVVESLEKAGLQVDISEGKIRVSGGSVPHDLAEEIRNHKAGIIVHIYKQMTNKADQLMKLIDDKGHSEYIEEYRDLLNKIEKTEHAIPHKELIKLYPYFYSSIAGIN